MQPTLKIDQVIESLDDFAGVEITVEEVEEADIFLKADRVKDLNLWGGELLFSVQKREISKSCHIL